MLQDLQSEMTQHMNHLKQLKDFDENLALEKQARAQEEQEKIKAKVIGIKFQGKYMGNEGKSNFGELFRIRPENRSFFLLFSSFLY